MTELADRLSAAAEEAAKVRAAEEALDEMREKFRAAIRDARDAGASYGLIGRMVGLSRQRVARIVARS